VVSDWGVGIEVALSVSVAAGMLACGASVGADSVVTLLTVVHAMKINIVMLITSKVFVPRLLIIKAPFFNDNKYADLCHSPI
jgi:hypothetical protein